MACSSSGGKEGAASSAASLQCGPLACATTFLEEANANLFCVMDIEHWQIRRGMSDKGQTWKRLIFSWLMFCVATWKGGRQQARRKVQLCCKLVWPEKAEKEVLAFFHWTRKHAGL